MFDLPKEKYRVYPIYVYAIRDLIIYMVSIALVIFLNAYTSQKDAMILSAISVVIASILGSLVVINFHEWAHYFGIAVGNSKAHMMPIQSITRLFLYRFKENNRHQNLMMMLSGLIIHWIIVLPIIFLLPNTGLTMIAFKSAVILWAFEIVLIELYIGYPRYLNKMDYNDCYKRHTPYRKRNLLISLLAAVPFVIGYLFLI
ncbi:hypothetical protein EZV73_02770 [Acidaminobacter sp. JC074]|uniref:hypothetical protein n=1 Tax=Acidaminobacter sp. JC074 TaxID=2530199 RepID=UPI001F112975|nr:hypothetical protein [Acidaminobacter sp. JC074]MCH4886470.1 hypothetical protein [Acidaminobacter sp. JC074]